MSRIELASLSEGLILTNTKSTFGPAIGATAYVYEHGTSTPVSVYGSEVGGGTLSQPLTASSQGLLPGWVEEGQRLDVVATYGGVTAPPRELIVPRLVSTGVINVKEAPYNAACDEVTDDTAAVQLAINALPANGGKLIVTGGCVCAGELDFHGRRSIVIDGLAGLSAGAGCASFLKYTGEGERFLNWRSTYGLITENIMIFASNASFTGKLIDLSHDPVLKTDSAYWKIAGCYLGMTSTTGGQPVFLDNAIDGTVEQNNINGGKYGIYGAEGGHYSNSIKVLGNTFRGQGTKQIENAHQAWTIQGNTFEALANGTAGGIDASPGRGGKIQGNWFGDVTAGEGGVQIIPGSGYDVSGNYVGGSAATTAVEIKAGVAGVHVHGNDFDTHLNGIVMAATAKDCVITPNFYTGVTNPWTKPTGSASAKAGAGASVVVAGQDGVGSITLTSGTTGREAGALLTVTLATVHTGSCLPVLQPYGANTGPLKAYISAVTTTSFTLAVEVAPAEAATYVWLYQLMTS
jgi:hypothetical protein